MLNITKIFIISHFTRIILGAVYYSPRYTCAVATLNPENADTYTMTAPQARDKRLPLQCTAVNSRAEICWIDRSRPNCVSAGNSDETALRQSTNLSQSSPSVSAGSGRLAADH